MYHTDDTIAAIASAPGGAARGIVRVSGPSTVSVLETCFRPRDASRLSEVRRPTVLPGTILLGSSRVGELAADLLLWPNERSYTRQPLAEVHTLGSRPLVSAVLQTVCRLGARLAQPGEFTLRAFLAGRLDLAQAEAVLGVIDASDSAQLQTALGQLAGGVTRPIEQVRNLLAELLAHLEAGLDFAEEDIRFITPREIDLQLSEAAASIDRLRLQLASRGRADSLPTAVLIGSPNVGKSSLFNALAAGARALVAGEPGTTRDYLSATLDLGGIACQLVDTAGIETDNQDFESTPRRQIEHIAQRLGHAQAQCGDVRLLCIDASRPINDSERQLLDVNPGGRRVVLLTKCDQPRRAELSVPALETSVLAGCGIEQVQAALREAVIELDRGETATDASAQRCAASLSAATDSLRRAIDLNRNAAGEELVGSELRVALDELSRVTGAVYTEDILDRIFSRFCIGK
jgi:tRNA modification GTPase